MLYVQNIVDKVPQGWGWREKLLVAHGLNSHILYVICHLYDPYYRAVNEFQTEEIMQCTHCRITRNPQDMFYMEGMSFCFCTKGERELYRIDVDPIGAGDSVCTIYVIVEN